MTKEAAKKAPWKAWLAAAAALGLSAYALGLLYEGFVAPGYASWMTTPFTDLAAARRAYDALPANAPPEARRRAAQRLVEADPANAESWTAVAYAERSAHGGLTAAGLTALDRSYALSLFDYRGAVWRVCFALENWDALTPALRQDVLIEAHLALKDRILAPRLRAALTMIANPSGRLAAVLILSQSARPA
jgi:hypothetical protein